MKSRFLSFPQNLVEIALLASNSLGLACFFPCLSDVLFVSAWLRIPRRAARSGSALRLGVSAAGASPRGKAPAGSADSVLPRWGEL